MINFIEILLKEIINILNLIVNLVYFVHFGDLPFNNFDRLLSLSSIFKS
jgi:hypothetical protein